MRSWPEGTNGGKKQGLGAKCIINRPEIRSASQLPVTSGLDFIQYVLISLQEAE